MAVSNSKVRVLAIALALGLLAGGGGQLAAQVPSPTEHGFWESIKTSRNPDEFRAYLEAYPKGFYANQARAKLAEIDGSTIIRPLTPGPSETTPSPPRPGPSPGPGPSGPSSTASVLTDYTIIREVQERLYNLNYQIRVLNGQLSEETRKAVSVWQSNMGFLANGDMTADQLARLRSENGYTNWGALAYEARGASAVVWNRPSRQDAERDALQECRKRAGRNANDCDVLTAGDNACGALGFYTGRAGGKQHWGAYASIRPTLAQATSHALSECQRQAKRPEACGLRLTFCADGSHK
jgi:hypothetical protein